jgi:double-GTPase-like protein
MVARRHLVIGLPGSGKTTFIAALWHVVQANEIPSALRLHKMDGDRTYLNELRDAWLQCTPVPRTSQHGEKRVRMLLADEGNAIHDLWLPDMSGETFQQQWAHREWTGEYDGMVADTDGALLFVRQEHPVEPHSLAQLNSLAARLTDRGAPQTTEAIDTPVVPKPWDPMESPTQVKLVDLTQLLMWRRPEIRWRIGIVVSAWDVERTHAQGPEDWCRQRLPLLSQFLGANEDRLRVRYYGVSAQGGALPDDALRLKTITKPSQRIEVIAGTSPATNDITLPVRELGDED